MSALKAIGKALFSRTMLGVLLLTGLGLGIWFGGPFLGLGESRPLEDVGVRIMLLVLTLSFVLFWLLHWPVSVVGGAALCLIIWYGFPLLAVGGAYPFAPEWVRLVMTGSIALLFALYLGHKLWTALKADNALLRKILHPASESPAREQVKELHHIVRKALGHLQSVTAGVSGLARVFQHSRYIYELPWYMVFGAPGTGKTTLLLNSGLKFPLAEQAGSMSLSGLRGTRNCVWWFTDEAVLIDTAGRYTTHETNAEVDAAEWRGFLGLLRKYRPRAPLNGAVVAVSVEELAQLSSGELDRLAANLRERLTELQAELGVSFPVYFLITKMDLIKGFRTYFQNLSSEGRRQVFGFTLPLDARNGRRPLADIRQACEGELLLLQKRLEQGLNLRLQEEFTPERRRELYCLPGDFRELTAPLMRLIDHIFFESRYGSANIRHALRGVYFTSAVQEDATLPLNKASLAQRLGALVRSAPTAFGAQPRTLTDSRSYFLENTLRRVIFPEAFLVRRNTRWELRFVLVRSLGHIVLLLSALGLSWALLGSADNNARLLEAVSGRTTILADNLRIVEKEKREAGIAYVLEQACALTNFPQLDTASPPFSYRVGLYSGAEVDAAASGLCVALRERFLLPRFAAILDANLEKALVRTASSDRPRNPDDALRLYEALHMVALFHDPSRFNADTLMNWFTAHMATTSAGGVFRDNPQLLTALRETLNHSPSFARPTPAPQSLLTVARERLLPLGREQRLYLLVRKQLSLEAPDDFLPARHTGDDGALVRTGASLAESLPGLFTYAGYHEVFLPKLGDWLPAAVETDAWLMAAKPDTRGGMGSLTELTRLNRDIRKRYYIEYVRLWTAFLESVRAGHGASPEQDLMLLNRLGSGDSPLDRLARAVVHETALSAKESSVGDQLAAQAEKKLRAATRTTQFKFGSVDEAAMVDSRFASLRKFVTGSVDPASARAAEVKPSAEMEEIRLLLTEFALYTRDLHKAAVNKTLPPASDITERLRAKALQSPPFISNVLLNLANRGTLQEGVSQGATLTALAEQVASPCSRLVGARYPFVRGGRDADPVEFARVFGPGGLVENAFAKHLASFVDTSTSPWLYTRDLPGAPQLEPFEKAAELRKALYGTGEDNIWRLPLRVSVADMDPRIERMDLHIAGKTLRYAHGPDQPLEVVWEGGGPKATVSLQFFPRNTGLKPLAESGPWALFRLLDRGTVVNRLSPEEFWVEFDLDGYALTLAISTQGVTPLGSDMFQELVCPGEPPATFNIQPLAEQP